MKTCKTCRKEKPLTDFVVNGRRILVGGEIKNNYRPDCRDCYNRFKRERYRTNPKYKNAMKEWRKTKKK